MVELGIAGGPRAELRQDATDALVSVLVAAASGDAKTWASGAVEIAAGLWARCLSAADVRPPGVPIGPRMLAEMGRDLARQGECVYLLDVGMGGKRRLLRAYKSDVWGDDPDPSSWWYRLTLTSPRSTRTVTAPAAEVVHVRYAAERHSPSRGLPPLAYATLTGSLTANLERSISDETGGPIANLIALPEGYNAQEIADGEDLPGDKLSQAISTARGRVLMPESTAAGWGDRQGAPRRDWDPVRLGPNPPSPLVSLRQHVESSVLGCFGIPAALSPSATTDGTAHREAIRRLWTTTISPISALIGEELSRVLEQEVTVQHGQAGGLTDVASRARAVKGLLDAGISRDEAMTRVGWGDPV